MAYHQRVSPFGAINDAQAEMLARYVLEEARLSLHQPQASTAGHRLSLAICRRLRLPRAWLRVYPEYTLIATCLMASLLGALIHHLPG